MSVLRDAIAAEVSRQLPRSEVLYGTVTDVDPLTVTLRGDTAPIPARPVDGYTPTVGATAVMLRVGQAVWAIAERGL